MTPTVYRLWFNYYKAGGLISFSKEMVRLFSRRSADPIMPPNAAAGFSRSAAAQKVCRSRLLRSAFSLALAGTCFLFLTGI